MKEVSVVIGVRDGGPHLRPSLESVLAQEGVDLEVVVVDDGSTDETPRVLAEAAARDPRLRVLRQEPTGLTHALVRGCAEATGRYLARHDADDLSLPGRLRRQVEALEGDAGAALATCGARLVGPEDEPLGEAVPSPDSAAETAALRSRRRGAYHGTVVMRADAYRAAGGYRTQFRYAQDADLWFRLTDRARLLPVPEVLYARRIRESDIGSDRRARQTAFADLAWECRLAREAGRSEDEWLRRGEASSREEAGASRGPDEPLGGAYFIGRCLLARRDSRARKYLWRALRRWPWSARTWGSLAQSLLLAPRERGA